MWFDLYRCSLITGLLSFGFVVATSVSAQQSIPAPAPDLTLTSVNPETLDRLHAPLLRDDLRIQGATSCATSNCHAGPRPGVLDLTARRSMEYQIWVENDPHAQSWRTICSDESLAMMRRLGILDGKKIVDRAGFDNCLACHNSTRRYDEPRYVSTSKQEVNSFLREGVGCSSCHGPSEQWIGNHFQYHWTPEGAAADGFVAAGDLYVRARMCASCHVGDKDRDMNHDIIAAGHPSLRYELATFHAWQPKHWRDEEAADKTAYEARLWLAGQVASTDASLALLESRANDAHSVSEWPEFAAYNCASCHHNLGLENDRTAMGGRRRATAIYSQWYDAGLRWLIQYRMTTGEATSEDEQLMAAMDRVRDEMERRPRPDAFNAALAAAQARVALANWFDGRPGVHERTHFRSDRLGNVVADAAGRGNTFQSWESAVQFYLAAVAARESWPGGWNGPMREVADQMQYGLQYPQMIDISRYAKRAGARGPQSNRLQIMSMAVDLAGHLGEVTPEPIVMDDDDPAEVRRRLDQLMAEVNEKWQQTRKARDQARATAEPPKGDTLEEPPRRRPKTAEELLREREQSRNNDQENNQDSDE